MSVHKKIAYLQGLTEGLAVSKGSREGRVLAGIVDVLGDIAENVNELEEYVESIDEDLNYLEEDVYEEVPDGQDLATDDFEEYIKVECPNCHEKVYFEANILDDEDVIEITCPTCEEVVFVNDEEVVGYVDEEYLPKIGTEDI